MRALVMGIVNVTPDSFSDGGQFLDAAAAIDHGRRLFAEGADIVDVGGESTRPGAEPVAPDEELRRVLPVVEALAAHGRVSIDTRHAEVAREALAAGATLLNDVSARLFEVAADAGAGWVAVHVGGSGDPRTMQDDPRYRDVVAEVEAVLVDRATAALGAGVDEVWIDPGIGFGKTIEHNLELLAHLDRLVATGFPVVVGTSRKGFLGRLHAASDARVASPSLPGLPGPDPSALTPVPSDDRIEGSLTTATWSAHLGARMVRAHDVRATVHALELVGS